MPAPILATKLYVPPPRPQVVHRARLLDRLQTGLQRAPGVILISAPAGFGKTTLVSAWIDHCRMLSADGESKEPTRNPQSKIGNLKFAWLSLDESDNDLARFLTYLVAALQTIAPKVGEAALGALHQRSRHLLTCY